MYSIVLYAIEVHITTMF